MTMKEEAAGLPGPAGLEPGLRRLTKRDERRRRATLNNVRDDTAEDEYTQFEALGNTDAGELDWGDESGELVVLADDPLAEDEAPHADYLNEYGLPAPRNDAEDRSARAVFKELRETCQACSYRRLCSFAPVALHIQRTTNPDARHTHYKILRYGLKKLVATGDNWYVTLLNIMAERERDGHLAGCLLAEAWSSYPDRMAELLNEVKDLSAPLLVNRPTIDEAGHARRLAPGQGVDPRMLRAQVFRGQLVRAASFLEDEELFNATFHSLEFIPDEEGRLHQHEIVAALTLLITDDISANEWVSELDEVAKEPFRATFAWKLSGEDAISIFFPYRRGKKRSYLYLDRDDDGLETITSIAKQPLYALLPNLFKVFDDDEKKIYRVFKEICRHINVRAGNYAAEEMLRGFIELEREDLMLFAVYAPALARAVGSYLDVANFDVMIKFLYRLRADSSRRNPNAQAAHEKIFAARADWGNVLDKVGAKIIREFFKILFRLNNSYLKRVYTTSTFIKLGEAAYLLTALAGWNAKGLDVELKNRKPLAFIAYGMQPPNKLSAVRARKFARVMDKYEDDPELWRSLEIGARMMAEIHGFESFEALHAAALEGDDLAPAEEEEKKSLRVPTKVKIRTLMPSDDEASDDFIPPPPAPMRKREAEDSVAASGLRLPATSRDLLISSAGDAAAFPEVPRRIDPNFAKQQGADVSAVEESAERSGFDRSQHARAKRRSRTQEALNRRDTDEALEADRQKAKRANFNIEDVLASKNMFPFRAKGDAERRKTMDLGDEDLSASKLDRHKTMDLGESRLVESGSFEEGVFIDSEELDRVGQGQRLLESGPVAVPDFLLEDDDDEEASRERDFDTRSFELLEESGQRPAIPKSARKTEPDLLQGGKIELHSFLDDDDDIEEEIAIDSGSGSQPNAIELPAFLDEDEDRLLQEDIVDSVDSAFAPLPASRTPADASALINISELLTPEEAEARRRKELRKKTRRRKSRRTKPEKLDAPLPDFFSDPDFIGKEKGRPPNRRNTVPQDETPPRRKKRRTRKDPAAEARRKFFKPKDGELPDLIDEPDDGSANAPSRRYTKRLVDSDPLESALPKDVDRIFSSEIPIPELPELLDDPLTFELEDEAKAIETPRRSRKSRSTKSRRRPSKTTRKPTRDADEPPRRKKRRTQD